MRFVEYLADTVRWALSEDEEAVYSRVVLILLLSILITGAALVASLI